MKDTENDATKTGRERHPGVALASQREIGEGVCMETEESLSGCSPPYWVIHSALLTHSHSVNKHGQMPPGSGTGQLAAMRGHSVP